MAETLGIIAACGQFIEQSTKIVKLGKDIYDKIRDAPKEIGAWREEIQSLQILASKIQSSPILQVDYLKPIVQQCETAGCDLLAAFDTIDFSKSDSLGRKTWKAIGGLAKEAEIRKLFERIGRLRSDLAVHIAVVQLNQTHEGFTEVKSGLENFRNWVEPGTEEEKCLRALFVTDPVSDREGIITSKGHRTPGTCEWIIDTEQYRNWDNSPSDLLWITGPPGKGKTYISIFLTQLLETSKQDDTVISFFCDNKVASRNTAIDILRCLMNQLVLQHNHLMSCLKPTWMLQRDILFKAHSFETLWRIFINMLRELDGKTVYCVIDALDECVESSLSSLAFKLRDLFESNRSQSPGQNLKLIILSREQPQVLPKYLCIFPHITLDDREEDVQLYVSDQVAQLAKSKRIENSSLSQHIKQTLQKRSEGTFLWVSLMIQDLELKTLDDIEVALGQLPRGLDAVYERILLQIKIEKQKPIADMLTWLTLATRPLKVVEICEAIGIESPTGVRRERVCIDYVRSCGHLLQLSVGTEEGWPRKTEPRNLKQVGRELDDTILDLMDKNTWLYVNLVHQSVKDFLLKPHTSELIREYAVREQEGHMMISSRLIDCLSDVESPLDSGIEEIALTAPLIKYANYQWDYHMRQIGEDCMAVVEAHPKFFGKSSQPRDQWWRWTLVWLEEEYDVPLLHAACAAGLLPVVRSLLLKRKTFLGLSRGGKVNRRVFPLCGRTPLHLATEGRYMGIVALLLKYGADPKKREGFGDNGATALHIALKIHANEVFHLLASTKRGRKFIVEELKSWSPAVDDAENLFGLARRTGQEDMYRSLIGKYHDDDQAKGYANSTTLYKAINVQHFGPNIVTHKELLESVLKRFDKPGKRKDLKQALGFITQDLHVSINATDENGNTVLHHGARTLNALRELLAFGIDLRRCNNRGETALHCNYKLFVEAEALHFMLKESGLDINTRDNRARTPLHSLAWTIGHTRFQYLIPLIPILKPHDREHLCHPALRTLMNFGADRSLRDVDGNTAGDIATRILDNHVSSQGCLLYGLCDYSDPELAAKKATREILATHVTVPVSASSVPLRLSSLESE